MGIVVNLGCLGDRCKSEGIRVGILFSFYVRRHSIFLITSAPPGEILLFRKIKQQTVTSGIILMSENSNVNILVSLK